MPLLLNLGPGDVRPEDWFNFGLPEHDLRSGIPLVDGCADGAVMHHVADQLTADELGRLVLPDVRRVLKPGAPLRLSCADIRVAAEEDAAWLAERGFDAPPAEALLRYATDDGARKMLLTPSALTEILHGVGFRRVRDPAWSEWESPVEKALGLCALDSREAESFYMRAFA